MILSEVKLWSLPTLMGKMHEVYVYTYVLSEGKNKSRELW